MPHPEAKYLRPAISPSTTEAERHFAQICASGDYEKVVESEARTQQYLTQGLCAAIYHKDLRIAEILLNKVASIDSDVLSAAASVKSLPIFQLLLEHGWDINAPFLGNMTMLM
ncbi:MAG: hypothetical protein HETSPECPRED_004497 [Heterodermia speciosa]|uniref:Ankyrin repeat protein n=1 Tax=Heterodermia speciosa TaxID=116794 RepID=A0A8H3IJQ4_9LECA|nr:MAG: hypothetical protein HETSPECPRED_004497 [Heterodermia speciosa]